MDAWAEIRRLSVAEGLSQRACARRFSLSLSLSRVTGREGLGRTNRNYEAWKEDCSSP